MKTFTKTKYLLGTMLIAACSFGFTACGDDNNDNNDGNGRNDEEATPVTSPTTISSNEGSAHFTHVYSNLVDENSGEYTYEISFSEFDMASIYLSKNISRLPKKASIADLVIKSNQKVENGIPTGTFQEGSWGMSGSFNVPLSADYEYEVPDGFWYFDATAGTLNISKSGNKYTITIDPLKAVWKKRNVSSEKYDEYTKTSTFIYQGTIRDITKELKDLEKEYDNED